MLTRTKVREWVNNSAYLARGRAYAEEGRVEIHRLLQMPGGSTYCEASVQGTIEYSVEVSFCDAALTMCDCDCPAFARTGDMCKHVAAVLLTLCDSVDTVQAGARMSGHIENAMRAQGEVWLDGMFEHVKRRRTNAVRLRHEARGDVRLFPVLHAMENRMGLELRIGRGRMYAVRGMAGFVESAWAGEPSTFGKELIFSHTEEELDPRDVALNREVLLLAENRSVIRGAQLMLVEQGLDNVMRLLLGHEAELRMEGRDPKRVRIVEGAGLIEGHMERSQRDYRLMLAAPRVCAGLRGAYTLCPEEGEIRCAFGSRFDALVPLLNIAQEWPGGLRMNETYAARVCRQLLLPAGDALHMNAGRELLLAFAPSPMRPRFYVDTDGEGKLTCRVTFDYGDAANVRRDEEGEAQAKEAVKRLFPQEEGADGYAFTGDEDALFALLSERLSELASDGEVMVAERLTRMNASQRRTMTFGVTRSGTQLLVRGDLGGLSQPELEAALNAYRQKRRYVRLTDGTFLSGEALEQAAQAGEVLRGLDLSAEELARGANVPLGRAMYLEAALADREEMKLDEPGELRDFVSRLSRARETDAEPPAGLRAALRPYQRAGYGWLLAMEAAGFGGILADDMGLGKTVQALAMLLHAKERDGAVRALVVCPASLQLNWQMEAARFAPALRCEVLSGTAAKRRAQIVREDAPELLISSYDQLRRDAQAYHGVTFTHVLLDEAQSIKNAASQGARAAKTLLARSRLALTGTPIENRLSELWSIFDFLMPGYLPPYKRFRERYEAPIVQEGDAGARENLRRLVAPFILRRMKADVLADLPEKVETIVGSELTAEQRRLYAAHAAKLAGELDAPGDGPQRRMQILAGLTRLRQLCCDPRLCLEGYAGGSGKLEQCASLCVQAVDEGHRVLLFSQFTTMLDLLAQRLAQEGLRLFLLTGDTPKEERMRLVERFNAGGADVFLISLKAGGTGLNLTGADVVIHYDPWWNTAAQNQATDRAYRIGQTRGVQVLRLIASGTIEERIAKLQEEKAALSDGILAGDAPAAPLDERTLRALLG